MPYAIPNMRNSLPPGLQKAQTSCNDTEAEHHQRKNAFVAVVIIELRDWSNKAFDKYAAKTVQLSHLVLSFAVHQY